ncbi:MAG: hypothetical protein ACE367_20615 [Acidimicrobiales bacterium]
MTARVRLVDEAVVELEDAARWYEEQRAGLGFGFVAAVDRTIDRMAHWPFSGSLIDGVDEVLQVRRLPVKRFPNYVAYLFGA